MRKFKFFGPSSQRSFLSLCATSVWCPLSVWIALGASFVIPCLAVLSFDANYAHAAEEEEVEREPQLGVLSGERRGGSEGLSVGAAGDVKDAFTDEQAPVTGSVSQYSEKLLAKVQNNSKESRYSLSFRVIELDKNDKKLRSSYFSAILGPGETWEREMRKQASTAQALLELTRAKNLTPKKKKADSNS
jgi:hypothetical protein